MAVAYDTYDDLFAVYNHPIATLDLYNFIVARYTDGNGDPTVGWLRRVGTSNQYRMTYNKYALWQSHEIGSGYFHSYKQRARYIIPRLTALGLNDTHRILIVGAGLGALVYAFRHANRFSNGTYPDFPNVWGIDSSTAIQNSYSEQRPDKGLISDVSLLGSIFTSKEHGLVNGDVIRFESTGALPLPCLVDTDYYIINADENTFQIASTLGGLTISLTSIGSGDIYYYEDVTTPICWSAFENKQPVRNALDAITGGFHTFHVIITEQVVEGLTAQEAVSFYDDCGAACIGADKSHVFHMVNPNGVDDSNVGYRFQSLADWQLERSDQSFVYIDTHNLTNSDYVLGGA